MMGSWPLTPATSLVFDIVMVKSRLLSPPGMEKVTSSSPIVCVHLYGRAACSSASFARAAASSAGVSSVERDQPCALRVEHGIYEQKPGMSNRQGICSHVPLSAIFGMCWEVSVWNLVEIERKPAELAGKEG